MKQSLIYCPEPKPNAPIRLVCFPYAGGSASIYMPWVNQLSKDVELSLIQLPGRGSRFGEPPYDTIKTLSEDVVDELSKLRRKDMIFYGHSMGARVAYEVTLMLHKKGDSLPIHVIAAGSTAPAVSRKAKNSYLLPDDEFLTHLMELKGTPDEVLSNRDLMELLLPALRADFKIVETYINNSSVVIPTKISVFAGKQDTTVELAVLEPWFDVFQESGGISWFDGGHFFINENGADVIAALKNKIQSSLCASFSL